MKQQPELEFLLSEELKNSGFNLNVNITPQTTIYEENFTQKNPFSKMAYQKFLAVREKFRINYQSIRQQQLIKSNLKIFENDDLKKE